MNAVEIEEAVSELAAQPFDAAEFPFQFITAFGAKKTTVDRLRRGDSNQSDVAGVLQRNNIHIAIAPAGGVGDTLAALRTSSRTATQKAKFILSTDGDTVEAEDLISGEVIACAYADLPRYFATFLPLAGISTVKEIKNNPIDVNPPYLGSTYQCVEQKEDIRTVVKCRTTASGFLDYVAGWFIKAADWLTFVPGRAAFVSTNSICQGQSVPILWPVIYETGCTIAFAHTSFRWANLASNKAVVTVVVIGLSRAGTFLRHLIEGDESGQNVRKGASISPYLTIGGQLIVEKQGQATQLSGMEFGNKPSDGGQLLIPSDRLSDLHLTREQQRKFIRKILGSEDVIHGSFRYCIWIEDRNLQEALDVPSLANRVESVRALRLASPDKGANALAKRAHQLKLMNIGRHHAIAVPIHTSENRPYLAVDIIDSGTTLTNAAFGLYDAPLWNMALIASRMHLVWISTICGKIKTDYRYSNTLGWNTFPVPKITEQDKSDLARAAENILLAREAHFPATIADLYDPKGMPDDLRRAHEENDEMLERIYIGRRFRNDTERLEKLFDLYTKMTAGAPKAKKGKQAA